MCMSENNMMLFDDVLKRYDELKYNYEYGFSWDKKITKKILDGKTDSIYRQINAILKDSIYDGVTIVKYDNKNTSRILTSKKPYSLNQRFWFQNLYGCYGMSDGYGSMELTCKKGGYIKCRGDNDELEDENGKCEYKCLCNICAEAEAITGLYFKDIKNPYVNRKALELYKDYSDMIEEINGVLYLKENSWTEENMKLIWKPYEEEKKDEKEGTKDERRDVQEEHYKRFLELISFFSVFSPLSVLGSNFLWKLRKQTQNQFFFIRGLEVASGLMQESIYRCLCAMHQNKRIVYEKEEYWPIYLYYRNNKMDVKNAELYLEAEKDGKIYKLPLQGHYIYVDKRSRKMREGDIRSREEESTHYIDYTIDFYTNSAEERGEITSYLDFRRQGIWKDKKTQNKMKHFQILHSPYYPENEEWEVWREEYRIPENDQEGFRRYILSFGEFAKIIDSNEEAPGSIQSSQRDDKISRNRNNRQKNNGNQKALIQNKDSLCNIFSARGILNEKWLNKESKKLGEEAKNIFKNLKEIILPPSEAELAWIDFIITNYKNMCQIFLSEAELNEIHNKIQQECNGDVKEKWFGEQRWDWKQKVRDCRGGLIHNYRKIYDTMRRRQCFRYINDKRVGDDKEVIILPYAMEFNVSKYMDSSQDYPFQIMCYDWKQKRNCLISYKDITVKHTITMKEVLLGGEDSILHYLYHILAYAVRKAQDINEKDKIGMDDKKIPEAVEQVIDIIWEKDSRQNEENTNFKKYIVKKIKNYKGDCKTYNDIYDSVRKTAEDHFMGKQIMDFLQNTFHYYCLKDSDFFDTREGTYHTFLLKCFSEACKVLKRQTVKRGKKLIERLNNFSADDVLEFILGEEKEGVIGEAAYYNEKLKLRDISFSLINNEKQDIDCIYSIFKSYVCKGELDTQERIRFHITYEEFNYRDIHKNLMAVRDLIDIESIEPEKVKAIIQKRMKAIEENDVK